MRNVLFGSLAAALATALVAGCGGPQQPTTQPDEVERRELTDLGGAYTLYVDQKKRPPTGSTDLRPYTPAFPYAGAGLAGR